MDSFTSLESLLSNETPIVSQSVAIDASSSLFESTSDGMPIDEERTGGGTSVAPPPSSLLYRYLIRTPLFSANVPPVYFHDTHTHHTLLLTHPSPLYAVYITSIHIPTYVPRARPSASRQRHTLTLFVPFPFLFLLLLIISHTYMNEPNAILIMPLHPLPPPESISRHPPPQSTNAWTLRHSRQSPSLPPPDDVST
ncbi:hypothetical protein C8R46DRAFT_1351951 [Mycena filopes]|nr:hypothetical protein C8R46DRAFT_1351951 [Mycena filopes]